MILTLAQVALGGAIGASLRYLVGRGTLYVFGPGFPWGTLTVNIVGSFAMGALIVLLERRGGMHLAPFLMTGLLGGFTTFSAFSLDAVFLFERGAFAQAALYMGASVIISVGALVAGLYATRMLTPVL